MSELNTAFPEWLVGERMARWRQQSDQTHELFLNAYNKAADYKNQTNFLSFQQKQKEAESLAQSSYVANKLAPVANALAGTSTPEQAWDVVSKNPQWMADPVQGQFVDKFLKTQTDIARAEVNTLQGKMKIADVTDFTKRLSTLDPTDRAAIQGMNGNPDGSISAMQWQALGVAEQRQKLALENQRKAAEIEALSRGDVPTTKITDKGVETTFKPATPEKGGAPKTMTIDGGVTLAWMPGGNTLHVIKANGEKNELTPTQLTNIAKGLAYDDKRRDQILEFLANKAVSQSAPETATTASSTNKVLKYNPANGKIE